MNKKTIENLIEELGDVAILELVKPFMKPKGADYNWIAIAKDEVREKEWEIWEARSKTLQGALRILIKMLKNSGQIPLTK